MTRKPSKSLLRVVATNVRDQRKKLGISQEELAERCGLHRTYIGSIERSERNVTLSSLEVIAKALDFSVPMLLTHSQKGVAND